MAQDETDALSMNLPPYYTGDNVPNAIQKGDLVNARQNLQGRDSYSHTGIAVYVDQVARQLKVQNYYGVYECALNGAELIDENDDKLPGHVRKMGMEIRSTLTKRT